LGQLAQLLGCEDFPDLKLEVGSLGHKFSLKFCDLLSQLFDALFVGLL
jgi:hypothetical protein